MFRVFYHPRAYKFLKKLPENQTRQITAKIDKLEHNPFSKEADIKKLATTKRSWRLRIGNIRVVYEVVSDKKIIYINDIDFRGNIY
jgi:mRNA interferase RelE/StbE